MPEARALLALHPGPDTSLPEAASLAGLTRPHTRQLLSELVQADLVDETVPGRYASHDLLRVHATELTESIDPPQQVRAARHRMLDHCPHTAREAVAPTDSRRAPAAGTDRFGRDGCARGCHAARVRNRRSIRASSKPTERAAASTVEPWLMRCSARSRRRVCW